MGLPLAGRKLVSGRAGVRAARATVALALAAGALMLGGTPASAANSWPVDCNARPSSSGTGESASATQVYSVPTQPSSGSSPTVSAFGAQPFNDGVALETWELTSPYVSPYDNAHGLGPSSGSGAPNKDGTYGSPTTPLTDDNGNILSTPTQTIDFPSGSTTVATMPLRVNVLLPPDYDPSGDTRYPVLYLLAGSADDSGFSQFLWQIDTEPSVLAAEQQYGHDMIVVMPDDSELGDTWDWYGTNSSYDNGADVPSWESFFIDQLVPFIDSTYPTQTQASGRFIAGLSAGGGAAMLLAGRNPGEFGAVGTFSGAVDGLANLGPYDFPHYIASADKGYTPQYEGPDGLCSAGDPYTGDSPNQLSYWQGVDPVFIDQQNPSAYANTKLWLVSGNGGAIAETGYGSAAQEVEYAVGIMTENFAAQVQGASDPENIKNRSWSQYNTGFPDTSGNTQPGAKVSSSGDINNCPSSTNLCVDVYSGGSHDKSYWQADLKSFLAYLEGGM